MKKRILIFLGIMLMINIIIVASSKERRTWFSNVFSGNCPLANFAANDTCLGKPVFFINKTTDIGEDTRFLWEFGDGTTSTELNPVHYYTATGSYLAVLTVTGTRFDPDGTINCTSVQRRTIVISEAGACLTCPSYFKIVNTEGCAGEPITFSFTNVGEIPSNATFQWAFGDGATSTERNPIHVFSTSGNYRIELTVESTIISGESSLRCTWVVTQDAGGEIRGKTITIPFCPPDNTPCCEGSFALIPGKEYMISAWVKEDTSTVFSYVNPSISLSFKGATILGPFRPKGDIIEGWQRIEEKFTVPSTAVAVRVDLNNDGVSHNVFFDDVRIYPFTGNMKSFVYDPITLRLVAELDENNYASVYEYNEEGELIRVKKETERGIMTINESRNSTKK